MNAGSRHYLIASCSIGLGLIAGASVLLLTTLAWAHIDNVPQLPTVLFFAALILLGYGCHRIDRLEAKERE